MARMLLGTDACWHSGLLAQMLVGVSCQRPHGFTLDHLQPVGTDACWRVVSAANRPGYSKNGKNTDASLDVQAAIPEAAAVGRGAWLPSPLDRRRGQGRQCGPWRQSPGSRRNRATAAASTRRTQSTKKKPKNTCTTDDPKSARSARSQTKRAWATTEMMCSNLTEMKRGVEINSEVMDKSRQPRFLRAKVIQHDRRWIKLVQSMI